MVWDFFRKLLVGDDDAPRPVDTVKLIHADDLQNWTSFVRCQDVEAITYGDYRAGVKELKRRRRLVASLINAQDRLAELDSDDLVHRPRVVRR